jgi:hypothetical protein
VCQTQRGLLRPPPPARTWATAAAAIGLQLPPTLLWDQFQRRSAVIPGSAGANSCSAPACWVVQQFTPISSIASHSAVVARIQRHRGTVAQTGVGSCRSSRQVSQLNHRPLLLAAAPPLLLQAGRRNDVSDSYAKALVELAEEKNTLEAVHADVDAVAGLIKEVRVIKVGRGLCHCCMAAEHSRSPSQLPAAALTFSPTSLMLPSLRRSTLLMSVDLPACLVLHHAVLRHNTYHPICCQ